MKESNQTKSKLKKKENPDTSISVLSTKESNGMTRIYMVFDHKNEKEIGLKTQKNG